MSQNDNAQDRNTEGMLYVHALYYLFINGPIKKDEFEGKIFNFLEENNLFFPEDLEIIESRATRSRPEKIYQQLRNLAKSNKSLAPSYFIVETDTHFELDHEIFTMLGSIFKVSPTATNGSASPRKVKTDLATLEGYSPKNILLLEPPGTGKTRASKVVAASLIAGPEFSISPENLNSSKYPDELSPKDALNLFCTQFHPSYSYEDFFEGLRPVQIINDDRVEVTYSIVSGIFKVACQIARAYLQPNDFGVELMVQFIRNTDGSHKWEVAESSTVAHYRLSDRPGYFEYNSKVVAYTGGAGVLSASEATANLPTKSGFFPVKWYFSGVNENKKFVLLIDELNRGNPAKIFGEALSLIEESKRFGRAEASEIMLPYSHELFAVPPNLSIICAMNSADKSLSSLDQAFRRRFKSVYLAPAFEIVTSKEFKESKKFLSDEVLESLKNHFLTINSSLRATRVPQENLIGHSFLLKLVNLSCVIVKEKNLSEKTDAASKVMIASIVRDKLKEAWEGELHSLVRDIVGDNKLQEFCDNFASEVAKTKTNLLFLNMGKDTAESLYKYLDNLRPEDQNFPWKSAA